MPMRVSTVRFSEEHRKLLELEATREGVSAAQFIRDATIVRPAYAMGQRGDEAFEEALGRVRPGPGAEAREKGAQRRQALLDAAAAAKDSDRLEALHATGLLDSDVNPSFDRLARLASKVLNAPVALVSLVDADRQFFKSCLGLPEPWATQRGTPLSHSFCQHAVASREPLIVDDSREHDLLRDNPAIRDIGVIAYAGIPLIDADGHALGTLCVIDSRPRHWTTDQVQLLSDLAASVVTEIAFAKAATQATPATPAAQATQARKARKPRTASTPSQPRLMPRRLTIGSFLAAARCRHVPEGSRLGEMLRRTGTGRRASASARIPETTARDETRLSASAPSSRPRSVKSERPRSAHLCGTSGDAARRRGAAGATASPADGPTRHPRVARPGGRAGGGGSARQRGGPQPHGRA